MTNLSVITASALATAIIDRAALVAALALTNKIIAPRNSIEVLSTVALSAHGSDAVLVRSTDLDIEVSVVVPAEAVDSRFSVCANAKALADIMKRSKAALVSLSAPVTPSGMPEDEKANTTSKITIGVGGLDAQISGRWYAEFPAMTEPKNATSFSMPGSTLRSALDTVRGAVSTDETRPYLNGVYMHVIAWRDWITFVATDGHRLMRQEFDAPAGSAAMPGVIMPRVAMDMLLAATKGRTCPARIDLDVSETRIRMRFGDVSILTKTIDGTFPDYQRVIPTSGELNARFASIALAEAIKAVSATSSARGRAVKLEVSEDACRISMRSDGEGTAASITIGCEYEGAKFEIGFNAGYLLSMIDTACPAEEKLTMRMADAGSPTVFFGGSPRFVGVLMPMRV